MSAAVLYSKAGCPFCAEARAGLEAEGIAFSAVEVVAAGAAAGGEGGASISVEELAALCGEAAETLTVPKLTIGEVLIRSSEELRDLRATTGLRELARREGIPLVEAQPRQLPSDAGAGAVCLLHTGPTLVIWLEELRARLRKSGATVFFLDAERLGPFDPAERLPYSVVVNRVSDAPTPALARFVASFLSVCAAQGIPVVNGAAAYPVANSKIAQHAIFQAQVPKELHALGLRAVPSQVVRSAADVDAAAALLGGGPILFKPNAGGFGKGIVSFDHVAALREHAQRPSAYGNDGVALLQRFYRVQRTHRVFLLDGRVQCAVVVAVEQGQFAGQCMASAQKRRRADGAPSVVAEALADGVRDSCLRVLRAAQADVGSIEYLEEPGTGELLYYDFNLLSTYPNEDVVGKDCWMELAEYILSRRKAQT